MKPVGARAQQVQDYLYYADGVIAAGGTSQLVLPRAKSRSYLYFQNQAIEPMYLEIGGAKATVSISGGALNAFTIVNGGFGYVKPPTVLLLGGGPVENVAIASMGAGLPDWPAPSDVGTAYATVAAGIVTAITVEKPGAGYLRAPYVQLINNDADAYGCADPFFGSAGKGYLIGAGGSLLFEQQCPTDPVAVYAATTNSAYLCRYMI